MLFAVNYVTCPAKGNTVITRWPFDFSGKQLTRLIGILFPITARRLLAAMFYMSQHVSRQENRIEQNLTLLEKILRKPLALYS